MKLLFLSTQFNADKGEVMRQLFRFFSMSLVVFCFTANANTAQILPYNTFQEGMKYWGGNPVCQKALQGVFFYEHFLSDFVPGQGGMIYLRLVNPASSRPPIDTYLFKDGDTDRYGFTNYYYPDVPLRANHQTVGLRGIILNICDDGQKQSALMIDVANGKTGGEDCVLSTHAWNYCR